MDEKFAEVKRYLPDDLVIVRTSDQPLQVKENIDLFMDALYEAIGLVVLVSLIGFWEWRSALLMALSIPITLAMTFGMLYVLGIDIQQVSVGDADHRPGPAGGRSCGGRRRHQTQPGRGPTEQRRGLARAHQLATAILYATITNIVAYLPFLMLRAPRESFFCVCPWS